MKSVINQNFYINNELTFKIVNSFRSSPGLSCSSKAACIGYSMLFPLLCEQVTLDTNSAVIKDKNIIIINIININFICCNVNAVLPMIQRQRYLAQ